MKIILSGVTDKTKWECLATQLVEALPYKFTGSIPDGVIRIFLFSLMIPAALATLRLWVRLILLT